MTEPSSTLPASYYTDPEIFRREIERFFFQRWICAGRTAFIPRPGDYFLREIAGESIIVTRDSGGDILAFSNVCRHRGTRMCTVPEGNFSGRIQCPYSRIGMNQASHGKTIRCILYKRITYDVKANWKLAVLNYNECLHCPLLHPALNRLTDYLGADNEPPDASCIGGSMRFRNGAEDERRKVSYYTIYPNLLLSLHPDYMMVHTLWPKAVDRTEVLCEWYFHPAEMAKPDFVADDAIEFWDTTNREDWSIVELCAYTPGPYSRREESTRSRGRNRVLSGVRTRACRVGTLADARAICEIGIENPIS